MLTTLTVILIGVLAVSIALAAGYFFLRARRREETAPDPSDAIVEMRALGQRIETLVGQQQLQGETARQHLAQKMDAVGDTVDQQRHHLAGLQNELRHEVRRRDAEMEDIRTQLASIQQTTRLAPPATLALPEAPAPEDPAEELPVSDTPAQDAPAFETPSFDAPAFETPTFEVPTFESPTFETPAEPFPAVPMGDGFAASFGDDGWDTGAPAPPPAAPTAPPVFTDPFASDDPFATPTPEPPALPVFESAPPFTTPDPFAAPDADPEPAPSSDFEPFDFEPFDFVPPADDALAAPSPPLSPTFSTQSFDAPAGVTFETVTPPPAAPAPPSQTAWIARADRPDDVPSVEAPAFEMPAFEPPSFAAMPVTEAAPPAAPAEPAVPTGPPAGADRLTLISSVDEAMQAALYAIGVTTLDEIARWNRTDARRISSEVSVSEDTIMNQWIFEAQAALFQSYAAAQNGR